MRDPVSEDDYFEQQIQDIDKDLRFNENSNTSMPTVDSCTKNAMQAMMDVEEEIKKKTEHAATCSESGPPFAFHKYFQFF